MPHGYEAKGRTLFFCRLETLPDHVWWRDNWDRGQLHHACGTTSTCYAAVAPQLPQAADADGRGIAAAPQTGL